MSAGAGRRWVWLTTVIAVALIAGGCRVSVSHTTSSDEAVLETPFKPPVSADQGPDGSPFLVIEGEPSTGSRTEITEVRGWADRTITIDNVTFDKFEIRRVNGAGSKLGFFSLCQPINMCTNTELPLNTCAATLQADRTSCHVVSTKGRSYELSLLDGHVTIAEATTAADIADTQP